jgi:metallopeptidase family M12-like protein
MPAAARTLASPLVFPERSSRAVRRAAEAGERLLDVDARAFADLRSIGRGESVRILSFPFAPDATADLVLERFEVAAPDARVLVETASGPEVRPMPSVAHFRGRLEGDEDSRVYIGVQPGFLVAIVRSGAGVVYVGPEGPTDGPVQHVLRRADSPLNDEFVPADWRCDADDLPQAPVGGAARIGEPALAPASVASVLQTAALREATVSIETDQELLAKYSGNVSAMTAYITTLLGAASVIYERDVQVHLALNLVQAWTTTDPYSSTSTRTQLDEVGDWWHTNRPKTSYPRTTVHYMSGKPVSGGIAWLDVLCMGDFSQGGGHWGGAYGVTQVNAAYPSSPWDLLAVTHELGHNFGSPHTHCYSPPIDMCYNAETGCYSGPIVNPGPLGGTIMSYCHLLAGGYGNIDMRFHERCISEQMLPEINSVSCLANYSSPEPTATLFYTVSPCRVLDTRNPTGPYGGPALAANTDRTVVVGGWCGIPTTARAIAVNVTVAQPTASGDLRLYAGGTARPMASSINYRAGQTRANNGFAQLGTAADLAIRCDQSSGNVQVIIDVNGYFQ